MDAEPPCRFTRDKMSGVEDCIRAAKPVFELFGVKDNLRVVHPESGHDFPSEAREQAYAFIDHALK